MKVLEGHFYTKEHGWVRVEKNMAYIGITDYAQHALGSIVFVELPEVDTVLDESDILSVVESVKAASDIYSPVSGKVIKTNQDVVDEPALLNQSPYESWLICVELSDESQLSTLMSPKDYEEFAK